tara:strand:+ start:8971 stop:9525 length:555 start_codon:yes stop_codon:yes gene_type:complete
MDFENLNIWYWIITALVGIICLVIGYFLGKSGKTTIDNSDELELCRDKTAKLEADILAYKKKLTESKSVAPTISTDKPEAILTTISFDAAAAKAAFKKTIKQDDLKLIEGIGPKIETMFKDAGIKTWLALSDTSVADCKKILDGGGNRYKIHDPSSWPMQAKMCYEGKWKNLVKWQDKHKAGKL